MIGQLSRPSRSSSRRLLQPQPQRLRSQSPQQQTQ